MPEVVKGPIVLIAGSLRSRSYTSVLLRRAGQLAADRFEVIEVDDVRALPHYDADLDGENATPVALQARATLTAASGVIISTPEYNGSIPGGLKNWVDWVTRPVRQHVLIGKPVAVLGGAPNERGAVRAVHYIAGLLGKLGAVVAGEPVVVPDIAAAIDEDGRVVVSVDRQLAQLVDALAAEIDGAGRRVV